MIYNKKIRDLCWYIYSSNGSVGSTIDRLRSMHTLDKVIVCKSKTNKKDINKIQNYKKITKDILTSIKDKEIIRDDLLRKANDGISFYYFEVTDKKNINRSNFLTDYDIEQITEINTTSIQDGKNVSIISLPVDYCRIIGRKNSVYEIAFNLEYFDDLKGCCSDSVFGSKLKGFPKEIRDKYDENRTNSLGKWIKLDSNKTIVTKIKSSISEIWGRPFSITAINNVNYTDYFNDTKRQILDEMNSKLVYQTYPESEKKGKTTLTESQQRTQHDALSNIVKNKGNSAGVNFVSLAAGTKLNVLDITGTEIFNDKNESSLDDNIIGSMGVAPSIINGNSKGNYSAQQSNLDLISSDIYNNWICPFVTELNKCINENIIKDKDYQVEVYYLPTTYINKDKVIKNLSDLYMKGKGSLTAWISATGFDPDMYFALMDDELEMDIENKYPVHKTSFTVSGKDLENSDVDQSSGRPKKDDAENENTIKSKTDGSNEQPKPSDSK